MTSPSEKPQPGTIHSTANIEELKEKLSLDRAEITVTPPESTPPSCVFNSQAPGNTIPVADVIRDIKLATQKVPTIETPELPEEESDETDNGPDAA